MKKTSLLLSIIFILLVAFAAQASDEPLDISTYKFITEGPSGETPTDSSEVVLTDEDVSAIKEGNYKVAILMHESSDWVNAVLAGAQDRFAELGFNVVAVTDAEQDPNKQRTDIETTLALQPDVIVTLVIDTVSSSVALKQAIDQGVKVVLISNLPQDFVQGKDYVGIVTDDLYAMGKNVAEMIGDDLGGKGDVALMYHDANYYVTNQRDEAVEAVLRKEYPEINIVTKRGIVNASDSETLASAILTQYPSVQAIYAPWDVLAEGVVAAARTTGNDNVGVYTIDIGANNAMDLAKGGNMKGIVADLPYELGKTLANMSGLAVLDKEAPAFVTVPAIKITKANLAEAWLESLNRDIPTEISDALK